MCSELIAIYQAISEKKPIVVATIISSRGSTPRTSGTRMLVHENGDISGTIGGGAIEGDVIRQAKEIFTTGKNLITTYDLLPSNSKDMDLICGGSMDVLLEHIKPEHESVSFYTEVAEAVTKGEGFLLSGKIKELHDSVEITREIVLLEKVDLNSREMRVEKSGDAYHIFEPVFPKQRVFIVGGGHISKELSILTSRIDFSTYIFDDREEFASSDRFPQAEGVHVCKEYDNIFDSFQIDSNCYIIIVTRGHHFDKKALSQALQRGAGYIGMIGSRKKRKAIYSSLISEGVPAQSLENVHCPIGLSIGAQTPAEIAVSIVAELIQLRGQWSG